MYYDWGVEHGCGEPDCKPSCTRCERFLEFWNLVFMEFALGSDGTLTPLPQQNVDTGMGVERTAAILQNVMTVYETDVYQAIMRWIAEESGVAYGDSPEATKAHRILADHGRGMTFLAADGVAPSNEGRGYVMRRIIRRAVQQAARVGLEPPYLARLSDVVIEQMKEGYPELEEHRDEIHRVLTAEEERFGKTLERGMRLFEETAQKGGDISGEDAFRLHDTYGFPLELTRELARERGLGVNEEEFTRLMEVQRTRSRGAISKDDDRAAEFAKAAGFRSEFVGFEKTDVLTQIGALEEIGDGLFLAKLRESPFYVAGGGQVTDAGWIERDDGSGARAELRDAYRLENDQALLFEGEGFAAGDRVRAVVPWAVRYPTMANHTATHLLHKALQGRARRPRSSGGLRGSPGQASVRLHPSAAADGRRARTGAAPRQRQDLPERPGPDVRDADRRSAQAGRDDALRREVRRSRARRRDRRVLAGALRRNTRPFDCGGWAFRDPERELGRGRCSAHRSGHLG